MNRAVSLRGDMTVPGDKSITHRSCMFGAIAQGTSVVVTNALGRDNLSCIRVLGQLGVRISGTLTPEMLELASDEGLLKDDATRFTASSDGTCRLTIVGNGFDGLQAPKEILDCGNSGTFARLLTGLLAGRPFEAELTGDASLVTRPFERVTEPLSAMGAWFSGDMLPFKMRGGTLRPINYGSPRATAQVKSAVLIAGLQCDGNVSVTEPNQSRDHTERMLSSMGVKLEEQKTADGRWQVRIVERPKALQPLDIAVPGDFSSASFFLVAASIIPGSDLTIRNIGYNPSRIGLLHILQRMGADITVLNERLVAGEKVADFHVRAAALRATDINAEDVVLAIDEIPILSVAAAVAQGVTKITGAKELRVKETDRLAVMADVLESFGVHCEQYEDGMKVPGLPSLVEEFAAGKRKQPPADAPWRTSGDHRIAMSGSVLETLLFGQFEIADQKAVETSFPGFSRHLNGVVTERVCEGSK